VEKIVNRTIPREWFSERFVSIAVDLNLDVDPTVLDGVTPPSNPPSDPCRVFFTPVIYFVDLDDNEM
jgi:hypothetical protein